MTQKWEIEEAIELIALAVPIRSYPGTGGLWFGNNSNLADATFDDWGMARATATLLNAINEGLLVMKQEGV